MTKIPVPGLKVLPVAVLGLCAGIMPPPGHAAPGDTQLVTATLAGLPSGQSYDRLSVSADGRYVAFQSSDPTLVPDDTNGVIDVFVRDVLTGTTERMSVGAGGEQANHESRYPSISADGRYVAFSSVAGNLIVPGGRSVQVNIFVRDRVLGTTRILAVDAAGTAPNSSSTSPAISGNGQYVAFASGATNWVTDDTNSTWDLFVSNLGTGTTERLSVSSGGEQANDDQFIAGISAEGRYVAFSSAASNLVPNDTNAKTDVFVRDSVAGTTERISVSSTGAQADDHCTNASISADGRYVSFTSAAKSLGRTFPNNVYLHDRLTGVTELVSIDGFGAALRGSVGSSSVSSDGRYVAFDYRPMGETQVQQVLLRDRAFKKTSWLSVSTSGALGNGDSYGAVLTPDARFLAFTSTATSFAPGDVENSSDGFIREIAPADFRFTVTPAALDFGQQALLTSSLPQVLWFRNWGTAPLPIVEIRRTGTDRAMFWISHTCGTVVAVGKGCAIRVKFAPTSVGPKTARVRVVAGDFVTRAKDLTGSGAP